MKLRIHGDSLRLRVSPSEVVGLLKSGRVEETIHLGPDVDAKLIYVLEHSSRAGSMELRYEPQRVTVVVASADAHRWAEGQDVGLYGAIPTAHGMLELAVEKDFACLGNNDAENADTFPNPRQGAVC